MPSFMIFLFCWLFPPQAPTCVSVHTGKFYSNTGDTRIVRSKTHQREVCARLMMDLTWKVRWTDECSYTMILEDDRSAKPWAFYKKSDTIRIRISNVTAEKYDWTAVYKGKSATGFNYLEK